MTIHLFVVSEGDDPPWVSAAWDEFSAEENDVGFREAVVYHEKQYGSRFRLAAVEIPDTFLPGLFEVPTVKARVP